MLKPAILFKDEIQKKFAEIMYSEDAFYYNGYAHCNLPIKIEPDECLYQWAICDDDKVVGYMSYRINMYTDSVDRFGLISFDKGNPVVVSDALYRIQQLVKKYRRIEWHCVSGNPAAKVYDKLCKRYNGYKATMHECTRDNDGNFRDSYIYEIFRKGVSNNVSE